MDAIVALKTRRSVRLFKPDPIPRNILEDVVDCGRLAPTAINMQPWEFIVVTDEATRSQIAKLTDHGAFIAEAPACVVVLCKDTKYYLEDGCNASTAILTAAHALGLGGCWVAGDKKPYAEQIRQLLGAPSGLKLISLLAIGYPAEKSQQTKRSLNDVLHWGKL